MLGQGHQKEGGQQPVNIRQTASSASSASDTGDRTGDGR